VSEQGPIASDGGHSGHTQGSEGGHQGDDDRHHHVPHESHPPEHNLRTQTLFKLLVASNLTTALIIAGVTYLGTVGFTELTRIKANADLEQLASLDQTAKEWRQQLQTNVDGFPFSLQAAEHLGSLRKLAKNSDSKIGCVALLRLSTAYFVTKKFKESIDQLETAEDKCADDMGLMEEIYYLHGRTNTEMANDNKAELRQTHEVLAWKNYNQSWRYGRQQKDFSAVTVLQMCILSPRRMDITAAEVRDLKSRLDGIRVDPVAAMIAAKRGLMTYLVAQEVPIASLLEKLVRKEALAEEKKVAATIPNLQMKIDPIQATTGPTKGLAEVFAQASRDKPSPGKKPAGKPHQKRTGRP
jgi:hypothetical protein